MRAELDLILNGGQVRRYHTLPTLTQETVGQHSYHVAWLCSLLSDKQPSSNLLLAALQHDIAEYATGDLPAPVKRELGLKKQFAKYEENVLRKSQSTIYLHALTLAERRTLDLADAFAGMVLCVHERKLGNTYVVQAFRNWMRYADEFTPFSPKEANMYHLLKGNWNDACK